MTIHDQYKTADNLSARANLHNRYSTNRHGCMPWIFDQLCEALPPRATILELGCGPGWLWVENLDRLPAGWDVLLSDISTGMVSAARENLHTSDHPFLYKQIDARSIPFIDGAFDAVIANFMLYHVAQVDRALAEIRRVLSPGGRFFAATFGSRHMKEIPDLVWRVDPTLPYSDGLLVPDAFQLENGGALLQDYFRDVELRLYEDALVVTDVDPLVAYARSACPPGVFTEDHAVALCDLIMAEMAATGAVIITKDVGLFEARKA